MEFHLLFSKTLDLSTDFLSSFLLILSFTLFDNISKSPIINQKKIDTCLKNWGVEHPSQNKDIMIKTLKTIENNRTYDLSNYWVYRYKSIQLLNKVRNEIFNNWNGYDYYDGEYIAENLTLKPSDRLYPTIDHKMSVYFAYINNISIEKVSDIENLCITKKGNNSRKNRKNEDVFKESFYISATKSTFTSFCFR